MRRPWLVPLVPLYAAAIKLRDARIASGHERVQRLSRPVISIGNLSTGGTGKTPFTIAVAKLLTAEGFDVDVLSRGYGRRESTVERVDPNGSAERFGDEPLLIARRTGVPVFVGRQRYQAGLLAEVEAVKTNCVHLLDDGFQHRQLHRDLDILILNREDWFDETLLPAGNLREPRQAIHRASVLAIPANETEIEADLRRTLPLDRGSDGPMWPGPIWKFQRKMSLPKIEGSVVAFCGIARPEQFFHGLEAEGIAISARHAFRDHHRFQSHDMEQLLSSLRTTGASALVTTAKDYVRLGALTRHLGQVAPLHTAELQLMLENEAAIRAWLKIRLQP